MDFNLTRFIYGVSPELMRNLLHQKAVNEFEGLGEKERNKLKLIREGNNTYFKMVLDNIIKKY